MSQPPITATLTWQGDLRFRASPGVPAARTLRGGVDVGKNDIIFDSDSDAGPSPPQAVAMALAGCMAIDVADIVTRGRYALTALEARIVGERAADPPRRFTRFTLHFTVSSNAPAHAVERAIALSREKYCSVWHSLRQDTPLETTFEVRSAA